MIWDFLFLFFGLALTVEMGNSKIKKRDFDWGKYVEKEYFGCAAQRI